MSQTKSNKERDIALVKKAIKGDQKAYSELMTLYWASVEKTFSLKLQSKEDVEDLSIATFSKAFDKLKSYNDSFAFSTWINTIATNTLIDFFRKNDVNFKKSLVEATQKISSNPTLLKNNTKTIETLVDGQGAKRISQILSKE